MPDTFETLGILTRKYRDAQEEKQGMYRLLTFAIRDAHDEGMTYYAISKQVGLSIAQVQRICDLSKDGGKS